MPLLARTRPGAVATSAVAPTSAGSAAIPGPVTPAAAAVTTTISGRADFGVVDPVCYSVAHVLQHEVGPFLGNPAAGNRVGQRGLTGLSRPLMSVSALIPWSVAISARLRPACLAA